MHLMQIVIPAGESPGWLRAGMTRLFSAERRLLHRSVPAKENTLAIRAAVELRRTRPTFVARTTVKGEPDAALQTALARLAAYFDGDNREAVTLQTVRPVVMRPSAPGTWMVQIGLPGMYAASAAPFPRSGKVRITAQLSETLAIVRRSGRPKPQAIARAEAAIRTAIADSDWAAAGPSQLRLHAAPSLLSRTAWFEIAMPIEPK